MSGYPWSGLPASTSPASSHSIRVDGEHPWDFFWGCGEHSRPQLMCRVPTHLAGTIPEEPPSLKNIDIRFTAHAGSIWCIMELQDRALEDVFKQFGMQLIDETRPVQTGREVLQAVFTHIRKWQKLLGKNGNGVLGESQQLGLFGELCQLRNLLLAGMDAGSACRSWVAPEGHTQDFQIPGKGVVEVKTRRASTADMVQISSQWQLWSPGTDINLAVFTVENDNAGESLYGIVSDLKRSIGNASEASSIFEEELEKCGYSDLMPAYDSIKWKLCNERYYHIDEGFPRITPGTIDQGITNVCYCISLHACEPFLEDKKSVF